MAVPDQLQAADEGTGSSAWDYFDHRGVTGLLLRSLILSYHNEETLSFTKDPNHVDLNLIPLPEPSLVWEA